MSDRRDIAEHVTSIGAAAVALSLPAATGIAPFVGPIVGLLGIGLDLRASSGAIAGRRAVKATLAALERTGEFRAEHIAAALLLLKDDARQVSVSPADWSAAARSDDFDRYLAKKVAGPVGADADPEIQRVLDVAFRVSVQALRRDDGFHRELSQNLLIDVARANGAQLHLLADMNRKLDELGRQFGTLGAALSDPRGLSRDQLELLAYRFEIAQASVLSDVVLFEELGKRAEDYRAYKARIDAIDERTVGLGNLKGAVREAVERLDFDEVETLLARVDEVETEIAAETKERRADNALMRGRVEDAFKMFSAAADSFGSVSAIEPARRRIGYSFFLCRHGERYGGPGLDFSATMAQNAIDHLSQKDNQIDWVEAKNSLAIPRLTQGQRLSGAESIAMLDIAVAACRDALLVCDRKEHPVPWARTQTNLGNALSIRGDRGFAGPVGQRRLAALRAMEDIEGAITAFRAALVVRTAAVWPMHYAKLHMNLGNALAVRGSHLMGGEGINDLREAARSYFAAIGVLNNINEPLLLSGAYNNLGSAFKIAGLRLDDLDGFNLLNQSIKYFRIALDIRTKVAHPLDWAMTTTNVGLAQKGIALNSQCMNSAAMLTEAAANLEAALTVYDLGTMPYDYARAADALVSVREKLGRDSA